MIDCARPVSWRSASSAPTPVRGPGSTRIWTPSANGAPLRRREGRQSDRPGGERGGRPTASTLGIRHLDFFLSVSDTFGGASAPRRWRPSPPLKPSPASRISRCKRPWARSSAVPSAMPPLWRKPWPMPGEPWSWGPPPWAWETPPEWPTPSIPSASCGGILERFRPEQISLHIHNTEGFGLANCVKAMELGFTPV